MLVLIDWPVYPRLAHTMRASNDAQCGADAAARRASRAMADTTSACIGGLLGAVGWEGRQGSRSALMVESEGADLSLHPCGSANRR